MTYLSIVINRILKDNPNKSMREIARIAGIDPSYLSRLKNGTQNGSISADILSALVLAISNRMQDRCELIAAHMKDQSCGYSPDFIQVLIEGKTSPSEQLHPDIAYLETRMQEPAIRNAVKSIVELHRSSNFMATNVATRRAR